MGLLVLFYRRATNKRGPWYREDPERQKVEQDTPAGVSSRGP